MKNFVAAFVLLLSASLSWATDYHLCDCQTGAHGSCVAGSNANAGTSSSAPKQTVAGVNFNTLALGDRVLFCAGGVWTPSSEIQIINPNATSASPLVLQDYAPPSGATGTPIIRRSSGNGFVFGSYLDHSGYHGGYTLRNLVIDGGLSDWGIWINTSVQDLTLENVTIREFIIAINTSNDAPNVIRRVNIRNSTFIDNVNMGWLGGTTDSVIEGNLFEANNVDTPEPTFSHAIYLGCSETTCARNVIRNNVFDRNSIDGSGVCQGGNLTAHGLIDQLTIENNLLVQDSSAPGCYGISITTGYPSVSNEEFFRVILRGNRVVNLGNCAICVDSAPGILIENNVVVQQNAHYHVGIHVPVATGDSPQTGANVRSNTVYMTQAGASSSGIIVNSGTGNAVTGNLIYFGSGSNSSHTCFGHSALSNFTRFDRNLCYHAGGTGGYSGSYANLSAAQAAGFDTNGSSANPLFVASPTSPTTWSCNVQSGSPAINTADSFAARLAYRGYLAVGTRDIGACEFGSTP